MWIELWQKYFNDTESLDSNTSTESLDSNTSTELNSLKGIIQKGTKYDSLNIESFSFNKTWNAVKKMEEIDKKGYEYFTNDQFSKIVNNMTLDFDKNSFMKVFDTNLELLITKKESTTSNNDLAKLLKENKASILKELGSAEALYDKCKKEIENNIKYLEEKSNILNNSQKENLINNIKTLYKMMLFIQWLDDTDSIEQITNLASNVIELKQWWLEGMILSNEHPLLWTVLWTLYITASGYNNIQSTISKWAYISSHKNETVGDYNKSYFNIPFKELNLNETIEVIEKKLNITDIRTSIEKLENNSVSSGASKRIWSIYEKALILKTLKELYPDNDAIKSISNNSVFLTDTVFSKKLFKIIYDNKPTLFAKYTINFLPDTFWFSKIVWDYANKWIWWLGTIWFLDNGSNRHLDLQKFGISELKDFLKYSHNVDEKIKKLDNITIKNNLNKDLGDKNKEIKDKKEEIKDKKLEINKLTKWKLLSFIRTNFGNELSTLNSELTTLQSELSSLESEKIGIESKISTFSVSQNNPKLKELKAILKLDNLAHSRFLANLIIEKILEKNSSLISDDDKKKIKALWKDIFNKINENWLIKNKNSIFEHIADKIKTTVSTWLSGILDSDIESYYNEWVTKINDARYNISNLNSTTTDIDKNYFDIEDHVSNSKSGSLFSKDRIKWLLKKMFN